MKKILLICIVTLCAVLKLNAQLLDTTLTPHKVDANSIIQKSKKQKSTAWILLGSGIGIAAIGGIIQLTHEGSRAGGFNLNFTGAGIAIGGGVLGLSSIPFFISSANIKKKANLIISSQSLSFAPALVQKQMAVGLKINL